jgi:hypothetical protein
MMCEGSRIGGCTVGATSLARRLWQLDAMDEAPNDGNSGRSC